MKSKSARPARRGGGARFGPGPLRGPSALLTGLLLLLGMGPFLGASELLLDFGRFRTGTPPVEFRPALTGTGSKPDWRIVEVEAASALAPLTEQARGVTRETVLAQLSEDPADERFPLLVYEPEIFADFTATVKFRTVRGRVERMAGLAFRLQDERNYYVVRVSSLGGTLRFYKFVDGVRSEPVGTDLKIPSGDWHELEIACKGNSIRCKLDGREAIPALTDTSFTKGKIALWTKSDAVSHFASVRIVYDALKTLPQRLVEDSMKEFPRLKEITIYSREGDAIRVAASSDATKVGEAGGNEEKLAIESGRIHAGSSKDDSVVVFPLRDRNGDPVFALRLKMRTFPGQTDENVTARGRIIVERLEGMVARAERPTD